MVYATMFVLFILLAVQVAMLRALSALREKTRHNAIQLQIYEEATKNRLEDLNNEVYNLCEFIAKEQFKHSMVVRKALREGTAFWYKTDDTTAVATLGVLFLSSLEYTKLLVRVGESAPKVVSEEEFLNRFVSFV